MGGIKMNENLDLTKILEGCPVGTEFYSSAFGNLTFVKITLFNTITMMTTRCQYSYAKDGRLYYGVGECTLFPSKDQRDWSKFERFWAKPKKADKFDPKTFQPFDKVLVRDYPTETWTIELFSYKRNTENSIRGLSYWWKQCIPYNEETKHLVGTKEDCPEYYKWWEE